MRPLRHLTPRYIVARMIEKIYRYRNPDVPWLTKTAIDILHTYLLPTDVGLEFGSGRSTLWFARRSAFLTSVEHNPEWHQRVNAWLTEESLDNVQYHLRPRDLETEGSEESSAYVRVTEEIAPGSLDFVLVDGVYRDACARATLSRLKPGGFLVLDNANLYLPCKSFAPNSRTYAQGPRSPGWAEFLDRTAGWRRIWTSNSVSDTAFFFRPN